MHANRRRSTEEAPRVSFHCSVTADGSEYWRSIPWAKCFGTRLAPARECRAFSLSPTVATASLLDDPNRKLMGLVLLAWFVALWVVAEFFDGVRRP